MVNLLIAKQIVVEKYRNFKFREIISRAKPGSCTKGNEAAWFGYVVLLAIDTESKESILYLTDINRYMTCMHKTTYSHYIESKMQPTSNLEGLNSFGFG